VGGLIARVADKILTAAYQWAFQWARSAVHQVISFILAPVFWVERHIDAIINTLQMMQFTISWIANQVMPARIASALATARGWVNQSISYTQQLVGNLATWTKGQLAALTSYVTAGLAADARYSLQLFDTAEKYTASAIAAESAYLQGALTQLTAFTVKGLADDATYALHLYGQSLAYTQALVGSQIGAIDIDLGNITHWVQGEVGSLSSAIALAQVQSFAFTRTLVGTVEGELSDLKLNCTDNLCSGLSDLASLFNALTGDLGLAALFALAGEFAHDPRAAAADVESTLGAVARDAAGAVRSLIGL